MKKYRVRSTPSHGIFAHTHRDGNWVPAQVAQSLYDALKYVCDGQGAQDFTTLYPEEFDMMRKALSLADGDE